MIIITKSIEYVLWSLNVSLPHNPYKRLRIFLDQRTIGIDTVREMITLYSADKRSSKIMVTSTLRQLPTNTKLPKNEQGGKK